VKIIESGISKETLSIMNVPFQVIQVVVGLSIGNFICNEQPLELFLKVYPIKYILIFNLFLY
jgi:hypothetical protein